MEDITDADYAQAKKACKDFEMKKLGEYHNFFVQSDTLLLADVFERLKNMCINIDELDPETFLSAPGLAWRAALKKTNVKLDFLTDNDMLVMVEKGIFTDMQKLLTNTWNVMTKIKNRHILNIGM